MKVLTVLKDLKAADLSAACSARHETELLGHFCSEASLAHRGEGVDPNLCVHVFVLRRMFSTVPSLVRELVEVPVVHGHDSVAGIVPQDVGVEESLAHRGEGVLPVIHGHDSVAGIAPRVFGAEARVSSENPHSRTQV